MSKHAFTLIELLIVVAIIAILAAIAIPNFLEAQTRAKVSRAKTDMRTIALGIEAYSVDTNKLPVPLGNINGSSWDKIIELTTPVAYLTSLPTSPFNVSYRWGLDCPPPRDYGTVFKMDYGWYSFQINPVAPTKYPMTWGDAARGGKSNLSRQGGMLKTFGPDQANSTGEWWALNKMLYKPDGIDSIYDPTNGTVSNGDICRIVGNADTDSYAPTAR